MRTQVSDLETLLTAAATAGGRAILRVSGKAATAKPDGSPVTAADLASNAAIQRVLQESMPGTTIVSEESTNHFSSRSAQKPFFLVDPLDGTKEYLAGRPEFAVSIGYIVNQRPAGGIVLAPLMRKAWIAADGRACLVELNEQLDEIEGFRRELHLFEKKSAATSLITSRSHQDSRSQQLLSLMPGCRHQAVGSAIKFGAIADGSADLYPRGNGSMEWDTAAGEAIIMAAGGCMLTENGEPLLYGKAKHDFRNTPFIAGSSAAIVHKALAQWAPC